MPMNKMIQSKDTEWQIDKKKKKRTCNMLPTRDSLERKIHRLESEGERYFMQMEIKFKWIEISFKYLC